MAADAPKKCSVFWGALEDFPPIVVRLAARHGSGHSTHAITGEEIAIVSDIPLVRVTWISQLFSWEPVPLGEVRRFCAACHFDPTSRVDRNRQRVYLDQCQRRNLTHRPPAFLRRHPAWATEFLPLIDRLRSHQASSNPSTSTGTSSGRTYASKP